jgi:hypothetical protein
MKDTDHPFGVHTDRFVMGLAGILFLSAAIGLTIVLFALVLQYPWLLILLLLVIGACYGIGWVGEKFI